MALTIKEWVLYCVLIAGDTRKEAVDLDKLREVW